MAFKPVENLSNHKLSIIKHSNSVEYLFHQEGTSHQAMRFEVIGERTLITGDWGWWILHRPVDLDRVPDRQYLKQKISAVPHQTTKSMQTFWFDALMDGLGDDV